MTCKASLLRMAEAASPEARHDIAATFRSSCRAAAHSIGEDRMNNLTIAIIAIAVAQALTILLTIGREREIKRQRAAESPR